MKILLTGASGFVGRAVWQALRQCGLAVRPVFRSQASVLAAECPADEAAVVPTLDGATEWTQALAGMDVVVHCAARAHVMRDEAVEPLVEYRRVNVGGTLHLARQAAAAGVRRFVFISSIGVNGNISRNPFTANDDAHPAEPYAQSKWEAEQGLWGIQQETGMEIVIIRPPLVYGPNAPGNFGSLVRWLKRGIPLPLGAVRNQRSLVGIDNLVDLILRCVEHSAAANQVFLAGDGEDLSTTDLLRRTAAAIGAPNRLVPVPMWLLNLVARLLRKGAVAQRLLGSLQVDISKTRDVLGWQPPLSVDEGLKKMAEHGS